MQRSHVRKLLEELLRSDSDLDAFCSDYFPEAYGCFSDGMDRERKRTILLDREGHEKVVAALQKHVAPDQFTAALSVLESLPHGLDNDEGAIRTATAPTTADRSSPRGRLLTGIDALQQDWAGRIGGFIDAYAGTTRSPNVFCGRDEDAGEVHAWLNRPDAPPNLLVTAPAGRGKSALMVRVAIALAQRDDIDVAFIPLSLRFDTHRPDIFLACLVARLEHLHGRKAPDPRHTNVDILQGMLQSDLASPLAGGRGLVVILDGLDEATGWRIRPGLLPAEHHRSIRIIVSARHQPNDPEGKRWRRALGWERLQDADCITLPLLQPRDVEAALGRLPSPLDRLSHRPEIIAELTRLCAGEPLTLWLMVDDIRNLGEAALDRDVSALRSRTPGLAAWFECWWEEQQTQWADSARQREPAVRALLNLLAVAKGGLTRDDILALAPGEISDHFLLDDALRALSRLIHGDGKTHGYVLQHPGFAQHLSERLTLQERKQWHGRLAKWSCTIADELIAGKRAPSEVPRYVVENRAAHLDEEAAPPEQWMSLATRHWYDAWQAHEPGPSGFLDGVDRAWKAVAGNNVERLADEAQCALIRGSIGSVLANVRPALLKLLLEHGIWTPEQALAYIREAPIGFGAENSRLDLVRAFEPHAPSELVPPLFEIACNMHGQPFVHATELLEHLLPRMARVSSTEAVVALRRIESSWARAKLLISLAEHLSFEKRESVLSEARDVAQQITSSASRAGILKQLAGCLSEPAQTQAQHDALRAAREISGPRELCYVLVDLVSVLPADLAAAASEEALSAASGLEDKERRYALEELIQKLPSPWRDKALVVLTAEIRAIEDLPEATHLWWRLLNRLPQAERGGYLDTAFDTIARIPDERNRAATVERVLFDHGNPKDARTSRQEIASRVVRIVQGLKQPWPRLRLLERLVNDLPPEELWALAEPAWPAVEEKVRGDVSPHEGHLFAHLIWIAPIDMALAAARQAKLAWLRAELLTVVARRLPLEKRFPVIGEALEAATGMVTPRKRAEILTRTLCAAPPEQQPAVFTMLCEATGSIERADLQADAWINLAHVLAEPWRTASLKGARDCAHAIVMPHIRFDYLLRIASHESDDRRAALLEETLEAAKQEPYARSQHPHLTELARIVEDSRRIELLRMALESTRHVDDIEVRVDAMIAYAAHLPPDEIDALADCIDQIGLPGARVRAYAQLLACRHDARAALFDRALAAAQATGCEPPAEGTRGLFLAQLIEIAPAAAQKALLREVLDATRNDLASAERPPDAALLEDEYADAFVCFTDKHTANALVIAEPHLPAEWIPEALEIAGEIGNVWERARATVRLAARVDEADRARLAEQIIAVNLVPRHSLDPAQMRRQLVVTVAPLLSEPRRSDLLAAFGLQSNSDLPPLASDLPDDILIERIDQQLSSDLPRATSRPLFPLLEQLPAERRTRVVDHLLSRVPALAPNVQVWLLAQIFPDAPAAWRDRWLEAMRFAGDFYHEPLRRCAPQLNAAQLDFALTVLDAQRSRAIPRDTRLEVLGVVAAERLRRPDAPRAKLRQRFHDTLRGRCETRVDVLATLSALAPLVVALCGTAAAIDVVRAIRRAGSWWP